MDIGDNMKKVNQTLQLISIGVLILYALYQQFPLIPFDLFKINFTDLPVVLKSIYLIMYEFVFASIIYFIYKKRLRTDFIAFKNNFKNFFKEYIDYWLIAFGLMVVSNFIIVTYFPTSNATNQEAIVELFKVIPMYTIISAILFAPFIEEVIFRLTIKNIFQNKYVFIIISGLLFGVMHVIGSFTTWIDLIYIIPYSIPGFVFAYILYKTNNTFIPISLHIIHNTFMILLQIILLFFL